MAYRRDAPKLVGSFLQTLALRRRDKGKPAARRGRKALGPATRGQAAGLPNGEQMWSLSRAPRPEPPSPPAREEGETVYASMKVALGRRGSVGPGLRVAALVALVASIAALLLLAYYGARPARAAGDCSTTAGTTTCTFA